MNGYYKPCPELDRCNELIEKYWKTGEYEACFSGHLELAEKGYPLAECQIGYFYLEGIGIPKNAERAFYWTQRAAEHGDRDGQYNLGTLYEGGIGTDQDSQKAKFWFQAAARQKQTLAMEKCRAYQSKR